MNNDDSLDLLDLDDGTSVDALPDATPFAAPRPRRPWLLLVIGVIVIILATYIIVKTIGGDSSSSVDVDLDAPAIVVDVPGDTITVPPANAIAPGVPVMPVPGQPTPPPAPADGGPVTLPMPAQAARPVAPVPPVAQNTGTPTRVIEDRREVVFNPDKTTAVAPAPKPATQKPVAKKPAAKKPAPKPAQKPQTVAAANGSWYVQLGSYSTRALAESAGSKIRSAHSSLFAGHQFVVLAAVMKDGNTLYRLRVPFANSADANGFCRNAKSDGIDCYVTK